jgi:hypothetical protein
MKKTIQIALLLSLTAVPTPSEARVNLPGPFRLFKRPVGITNNNGARTRHRIGALLRRQRCQHALEVFKKNARAVLRRKRRAALGLLLCFSGACLWAPPAHAGVVLANAPPAAAEPGPPSPNAPVSHLGFEIYSGPIFESGDAPRYRFHPVPEERTPQLKQAISEVVRLMETNPSCSCFFKSVGRGIAFQDLLTNRGIRISWSPSDLYDGWVDYIGTGHNVCVTQRAFGKGLDEVVKTIIHESAHLAGVGGRYEPNDAKSHYRAHQIEYVCTGIPLAASGNLSAEEIQQAMRFPVPTCPLPAEAR